MKFKSYNSCAKYLFSLERSGIKYNLSNIRKLSKLCGNPHKKLKAIHIAGTNGKGSTASIISSILTENNKSTGLYTSPHIKDFRERIKISGKPIPKSYVISFTEKLFKAIEKIKPSFFEVTTAMAFKYFADNDVDFAVVECGLGGRLDSTNILRPIVSVITSISTDHTEYLGNTIKSIAYEKAGIIKRNLPCIDGNRSKYVKSIIRKACRDKESFYIDSTKLKIKKVKTNREGHNIHFEGFEKNIFFPLQGEYQINNLKTALSVLMYLGRMSYIQIDFKEVEKGLKNIKLNTGYRFRFEKISIKPTIILDVSHNTEGISNIKGNLNKYDYDKLIIIFGMMSDKEIDKCISELEKLNGFTILTKPSYKRAGNPEDFAKYFVNKRKFILKKNVEESFLYARQIATRKDLILITGSFFMISDFLKYFKEYDKSNNF